MFVFYIRFDLNLQYLYFVAKIEKAKARGSTQAVQYYISRQISYREDTLKKKKRILY